MVATLTELDVDIIEVESLDATLRKTCKDAKVFAINSLIVLRLELCKTHIDHSLFEWRYCVFNLVLESPQEVWFDYFM